MDRFRIVARARALVTGVAGFIGSHLAERLLDDGMVVRGVDCLTDYYDTAIKQANLAALQARDNFEFRSLDLATDPLESLTRDVEVVFHQAATPGVRASWSDGFIASVTNNVTATQRLLEAVRHAEIERFVYASSSSVYGQASEIPMREDGPLRPYSPYGVTKLSAEQLCTVYAENFGVPTVSLRYFTVYGPRQRPDMATHRMIQSALTDRPFPLFGAAGHVRDFTYVDDVVAANVAALRADVAPGTICNIAGGSIVTIHALMEAVEEATGRPLPVDDQGAKAGDVTHTEADLAHTRAVLGWSSRVSLADGLAAQADWHREHTELLTPND